MQRPVLFAELKLNSRVRCCSQVLTMLQMQLLWAFVSAVCVLCGTMNISAYSQTVRAQATLDTSAILIGEQVKLHFSVQHPTGVIVDFPDMPDTISRKIEVVERSVIDSLTENGRVEQRRTITLTSFDAGLYELPPFTFRYRNPKDTVTYTAQTNALALAVTTVPVDTTQSYRDIKPPIDVPLTFMEILPYILLGVALVGIIIAVVMYIRKKMAQKPAPQAPIEPTKPAYEIAMEQLERLKEERLWQQGNTKEYHTRLSDIMRVYVEKTYNIVTLETVTDEIIRQFRLQIAPAGTAEMLRFVLEKADMVKFARYEPLPEEHDKSLRLAMEFVTITATFMSRQSEESLHSHESGTKKGQPA